MYRSGQRVVTQAIQKYLGSSYDVVKKVYDNLTLLLGLQTLADNADKVVDVADNLDDVTSVADNLTDVSAVADNIVAVTEVNVKVDDFNTKYLGSYASAPTVDGNGDPLVEGATYWDTTLNAMFVYTGSQWVKPTGTGIVNVDTFTGGGSTASFPLDVSPANKTNTSVFIDGVYQEKDTYSVSTNLITFNTAPNDEASIEVIVNEITNFITGTQTETHTLTSGQTVVNLTNSPAFASFHIQGEDVDSQRLDLGTDYTLDLLTNTITLTNSYPENTVLKMLYGYDDDISVELAPLNQAILDHVNAAENAHPASAIELNSGASVQQHLDDLANPDSDVLVGGVEAGVVGKSVMQRERSNLSPVLLEQFVNYLGGRGMLADETPNIVTERFITSSNAKGSTTIAVANTENIVIGGRIVIYHSEVGLYEPYFVVSKSVTTIGLSTGLRHPVTAGESKLERLWYNQPHPGKFYMRMLAQKIARMPSDELSIAGSGRLYFSQFDSNPTEGNDLATGLGGGSVAYVNELNVSQGLLSSPLESMIGRALFIAGSADGFGAELPLFKTYGITDAVLSVAIMCRDPAVNIEIRLMDTDGFVQTAIPVNKSQLRNMGLYKYPIKMSGRTEQIKLQVVAASGVTAETSIIVDQIEVYTASGIGTLPVIDKTKPCKIVGLGDSWIAGDITQSERESILTQLAIELPNAAIINAGVGGQKVWEMYNRFETDVAVHNPDYVIINTGTNDCYSPISGVFFPNSVDQFERYYNLLIGKIMAIGAKPIIIGVPALAEADGARVDWELNNRAKTYNRYFYKRLSQVVNYDADIPAPIEPVITDFTPVLKIDNSETGIVYTSRVGKYSKNGRVVTFTIKMTLSSKGTSAGFVTIDMPPFTNAGGATPFSTLCSNVVDATAMYAIGSIGLTAQMRLQIPTATGTVAATEANIANNSIIQVSGSYLTSS